MEEHAGVGGHRQRLSVAAMRTAQFRNEHQSHSHQTIPRAPTTHFPCPEGADVSQDSPIQWTDKTWNPIRGCSRVSEGCRYCYAEGIAARFSGPGMAYEGLARRRSNGEPQWTGEVRVVDSAMDAPLHWRKPAKVFVNSMSDLFHENVSDGTIDRVFGVMA